MAVRSFCGAIRKVRLDVIEHDPASLDNSVTAGAAHGPCVVADPSEESQARGVDGEIFGGGFAAIAIGYSLSDHLAHSICWLKRFQRWARGRFGTHGFLLDAAVIEPDRARGRWLAGCRRCWKSPLSISRQLRVERAVHLLETQMRSVEEIAGRVGYADVNDAADFATTSVGAWASGRFRRAL